MKKNTECKHPVDCIYFDDDFIEKSFPCDDCPYADELTYTKEADIE
jgi:hypothetical protein